MDMIYYILNTCAAPPRSTFVTSNMNAYHLNWTLYVFTWHWKVFFVSFSRWVPNFRGFFFVNFRAGIWVYNRRHLAGIWLRGRLGPHASWQNVTPYGFEKTHSTFYLFLGCWWHVDLLISRIVFDSWNKNINQEHRAMFLNLFVCCLFSGLEFQIGSSTSDSQLITVTKGNNFHPPKYVCQTDWCSSQYVGRWIRMLRRQLPALREMWHAHQCDYLSRKFVRSQYLGHLPKMSLYLPFLQRFNHCTFDLTVLIQMANCCKATW